MSRMQKNELPITALILFMMTSVVTPLGTCSEAECVLRVLMIFNLIKIMHHVFVQCGQVNYFVV
jgi:hypothetical protein